MTPSMGRITHDKDGGFILNLPTHRRLYKASDMGDLFEAKRTHLLDGWAPLEGGSTMRRVIWNKFKSHGVVMPWREENGVTMKIEGFYQLLQGAGNRLRGTWVCTFCEAVYEDSPREVDHLGGHGCRNGACPEYIRRIEALRAMPDEDKLPWGG